jgi:hypothetical protein
VKKNTIKRAKESNLALTLLLLLLLVRADGVA